MSDDWVEQAPGDIPEITAVHDRLRGAPVDRLFREYLDNRDLADRMRVRASRRRSIEFILMAAIALIWAAASLPVLYLPLSFLLRPAALYVVYSIGLLVLAPYVVGYLLSRLYRLIESPEQIRLRAQIAGRTYQVAAATLSARPFSEVADRWRQLWNVGTVGLPPLYTFTRHTSLATSTEAAIREGRWADIPSRSP